MQNNCVTLNCPYIFMCKEYHLYRERGERCQIRDAITETAMREANRTRETQVRYDEGYEGEPKISILKRVRQSTGCTLKEAHEACQKTGYNYSLAVSYIENTER